MLVESILETFQSPVADARRFVGCNIRTHDSAHGGTELPAAGEFLRVVELSFHKWRMARLARSHGRKVLAIECLITLRRSLIRLRDVLWHTLHHERDQEF